MQLSTQARNMQYQQNIGQASTPSMDIRNNPYYLPFQPQQPYIGSSLRAIQNQNEFTSPSHQYQRPLLDHPRPSSRSMGSNLNSNHGPPRSLTSKDPTNNEKFSRLPLSSQVQGRREEVSREPNPDFRCE